MTTMSNLPLYTFCAQDPKPIDMPSQIRFQAMKSLFQSIVRFATKQVASRSTRPTIAMWCAIALLMSLSSPAWAGEWVVDHYVESGQVHGVSVYIGDSEDPDTFHYFFNEIQGEGRFDGQNSGPGAGRSASFHKLYSNSTTYAGYDWESRVDVYPNENKYIYLKVTSHAVFKWISSNGESPDLKQKVYIRERANTTAACSRTSLSPASEVFTVNGLKNGLNSEQSAPIYDTNGGFQVSCSGSRVKGVRLSGKNTNNQGEIFANGPDCTFSGKINVNIEKVRIDYGQVLANLSCNYVAQPVVFNLGVQAPVISRNTLPSGKQNIEAIAHLRWIFAEDIETPGAEGQFHAKPDPNILKQYLGFGQLDYAAPVPYFEGLATFDLTARMNDGYAIYNPQTFKWDPEASTDPFAVKGEDEPWIYPSTDNHRTYAWNLGPAPSGSGTPGGEGDNYLGSSDVSVEVTPGSEDQGEAIEARARIRWYSTWSSTQTGLQKNTLTGPTDIFIRPDGSPIFARDIKPGDSIQAFVKGDSGFSTDSGLRVSARPVLFGQQMTPGPGERIENRVVVDVTPTAGGGSIISFKETPQVNPDDNPDNSEFEAIQASRAAEEAHRQVNETGQFLVKSAYEIQVEGIKLITTERLNGWAFGSAINGVIELGKVAESARVLRAGEAFLIKGAQEARAAANDAGILQKRLASGTREAEELRKRVVTLERFAALNESRLKEARDTATTGERYIAKILAEIKKDGCFVAGTPVWMSDGTLKSIENVKVGESVLSKNENTGEIASKEVSRVSIKSNITTLKLIFSDGSSIETTHEHPFYEKGKGFVKAGELGLGSSIVTRAGPSLSVTNIQRDIRSTTVYNLTVSDHHTYFVGESGVWVHNADSCVVIDDFTLYGGTDKNFIMGQFYADGHVEYGVQVLVKTNSPEIQRGHQLFEAMVNKIGGIDKIKSFHCSFIDDNATAINNSLKAGNRIEEAVKETTTYKWLQSKYPGENYTKFHWDTLVTRLKNDGSGDYSKVEIVLTRE
jgi:hypothetical protein